MSRRKRKLKEVEYIPDDNGRYVPCTFPEPYPMQPDFTDKEWSDTIRLIAVLRRGILS